MSRSQELELLQSLRVFRDQKRREMKSAAAGLAETYGISAIAAQHLLEQALDGSDTLDAQVSTTLKRSHR